MKQHWSTPKPYSIDAAPAGQWKKVIEAVPAKTVLRIEAKGSWSVGSLPCTPDGVLVAPAESKALPNYPAGALLGKLGGSTSGSAEGTIFAIGEYCVVQSGDNPVPLFVAINVSATATLDAKEKIALTISEAE